MRYVIYENKRLSEKTRVFARVDHGETQLIIAPSFSHGKNISRSKEISNDTGPIHARWKAEGGTRHGNKSFAVRDRMIDVCSGKKNARFAAVTKWQIGVETSLVRIWGRLG